MNFELNIEVILLTGCQETTLCDYIAALDISCGLVCFVLKIILEYILPDSYTEA